MPEKGAVAQRAHDGGTAAVGPAGTFTLSAADLDAQPVQGDPAGLFGGSFSIDLADLD